MASKWFSEIFILLSLLSSWTVAVPDPLLRARHGGVIDSRELCYDDDVLWSFQYWSRDSTPYCSSLLDIKDQTLTADPVTSYATESTVVTTEYDDPTDTLTIPQVTVFSTATTTVARILGRAPVEDQPSCSAGEECANTGNYTEVVAVTAGDPVPAPLNYTAPAPPLPEPTLIAPEPTVIAPEPTLIAPAPSPPFFTGIQSTNPGPVPITANPVPSILADSATNASIASFVFSACSCLRLKPKIVHVTPTVQTTRTISGIDYEAQPSVGGGTTTVIVTSSVLPPIVGPPVANSSVLSSGASAPSGGVISSTLAPSPPIDSFHSPTGTAGSRTSLKPSSGLRPIATGTNSPQISDVLRNSSSGFPLASPTDILPPRNASTGGTSKASLVTAPPATPPVPLSSSRPAPLSVSSSGGSRADSAASSHTPAFPPNGTKLASGTVGAATSMSSSQPSLLPLGTSIDPRGCPTINNTIFADETVNPPQRYQIQCYREFTGLSYAGLAEPHARTCIEECDKVNHGFSMLQCYGVSWLPYAGDAASVRCLLKTQEGLGDFVPNTLSLSAVLLDGVPPPVVGAYSPPPKEIDGTWYPSGP